MKKRQNLHPVIGIIGGTGLYDLPSFENPQWVSVTSPFGEPSDQVLIGIIKDVRVAFLPRHGRFHNIPPNKINYQANIDVLKRIGVNRIISFSAVGSLREHLHPGDFVLVDQYIDKTNERVNSFFDKGIVAHVGMADPTCIETNSVITSLSKSSGNEIIPGGTYITINGPQFSTRAESQTYRSWGADVIGMTNMPEAKLSREAELCYSTIAMVTDYDCWHQDHSNVTTESIIDSLNKNIKTAKNIILNIVPKIGKLPIPCKSGCNNSLDHAIATPSANWDPEMADKLSFIIGRIKETNGW